MGSRVKDPADSPPDQWRTLPCPQCGHTITAVNGPYLRWLRERAGIDQRTLAAELEISGPYLSDVERNRRECPPRIEREYRRLKPRRR